MELELITDKSVYINIILSFHCHLHKLNKNSIKYHKEYKFHQFQSKFDNYYIIYYFYYVTKFS